MKLFLVIALLVIALLVLTGCSARICSPWDPRCDIDKDCCIKECKIECIESTCRKK